MKRGLLAENGGGGEKTVLLIGAVLASRHDINDIITRKRGKIYYK
jgi:hypothetical protein